MEKHNVEAAIEAKNLEGKKKDGPKPGKALNERYRLRVSINVKEKEES